MKKSLNFKKMVIKKNQKSFTVYCSNHLDFWNKLSEGIWEPRTFEILSKFLDKDHSYIEIGAWIGPTVLFGCQLAKHCYAIEPDPVAYKELKKNLDLNSHLKSFVTLDPICISDSDGVIKLFTPSETLSGGGRSNSTILGNGMQNYWTVKACTFTTFIKHFSIIDCNFIKIDIEGAEFKILPTMLDFLKNNKPTLFIEIHPMFVTNYLNDLQKLKPVFDCFYHIYDLDLKEIQYDHLKTIDQSKTFHIVLSNLKLS